MNMALTKGACDKTVYTYRLERTHSYITCRRRILRRIDSARKQVPTYCSLGGTVQKLMHYGDEELEE